MDYLKSDEAEKSESSESNREVQEEKEETSKSEPSGSVDVKATKEKLLRSDTEVQKDDIIIPGVSDDKNLESLNSDIKVEKEKNLKFLISIAPVEKESKIEESVESNDVIEVEISKDVPSSVSVGNPSNIDVSTFRPSVIDCTSSDDPNPEESSKSNIGDKELHLYDEIHSMGSDEKVSGTSAPSLEETGLNIHKKKPLNLHLKLKGFHSMIKNTPKKLSEEKISKASLPKEDSPLIKKPITELPSVSTESKGTSELKETEPTSIASSRTLSEQIESSIQTLSSPPSTSSGSSRNLETSRSVEGISSSLENCSSPSVPVEAPLDPIIGDFYEREFDELNGVISNKFAGAQIVMNIIPVFEHLLNDLLELKAFLYGIGRASCNPCDDPDYGPTLDERLFTSRTDDFGTGVESTAAQNTRSLLSDLFPTRLVAVTAGRHGELRPEVGAEGGGESLGKCDTEQETVAESVEIEPSVSGDSTRLQESTELQSTPALDPRLEVETNPFAISRQLLRLSSVVRRQLHRCIITTRQVVSCCITSSPHLFLPRLERFLAEILDVLEHLVSLREECSALLSICCNREDSKGVIYILKVETQISAAYNKLLQNILTLTSNFNVNSSRDSD